MTYEEKLERFLYYRDLEERLVHGEFYSREDDPEFEYYEFDYAEEVVAFVDSLTNDDKCQLRHEDKEFYDFLVKFREDIEKGNYYDYTQYE